jgi:hypothetical protein
MQSELFIGKNFRFFLPSQILNSMSNGEIILYHTEDGKTFIKIKGGLK